MTKTARAMTGSVQGVKFAVAICEALGVNPDQVTKMVIVIDPGEPLKVTCDLLADESLCNVELPTIETEEREQLLAMHRERVKGIV